ncbi:MAG TPA: hypothetical protein VKI44_08420 [Acetobacteraceae bacterium]|nr:hypothetical protein [Acetobacteraceae bacterium]
MSDSPETRDEGFCWVVLGQNPPEIAYWERGEWWLCGEDRPWQPEAVTVVSKPAFVQAPAVVNSVMRHLCHPQEPEHKVAMPQICRMDQSLLGNNIL